MNRENIKNLLEDVQKGEVSPDEAMGVLRHLPYEDIGVACIDHHRSIRQGFPEVIYCEGKTDDQVVKIVKKMREAGSDVLGTRASEPLFQKISEFEKSVQYNKEARTIVIQDKPKPLTDGILIAAAGSSDIPVAEEASVTAQTMGSAVTKLYDVGVAGIHRLFEKKELLFEARVIIVIAGMDGALASVIGGLVDKPVVAVPTSVGYGASFQGISALLSMLNSCAPGVGVMNIDNGFGGGCFAHKINALASSQVNRLKTED